MAKHKKRRVIEVAPAAACGQLGTPPPPGSNWQTCRTSIGRISASRCESRGIRTRSSVGNPDTLGFMTMPRAGAALGR